ncbi:hypothetical protein PENANT_c025G11315 [Penicillium antarcticum]|uniref:Zn(2)-C6 fungal-type domain-containing protein n=1 Tax=Penicillium antarcticum TaxID=416450 RepID=A0A1V6PXQ3_9EURO|nr:hypothetical protein PENANT_c025G11315 [Penicillium antarcticum]
MTGSRPVRQRTAQACNRCRRQKLKCDSNRPCLLCVHSGNQCETSARTPAKLTTGITKRRQRTKPAQDVPGSSGLSQGKSAAPSAKPSSNDHTTEKQPSENVSTLDFVRQVFNEAETGRSVTRESVLGDSGIAIPENIRWSLKNLQLPPESVMWAAIDAYFSRAHWFVLMFHEPTFRTTAQRVLASTSGTWERQELSDVIVVLMVVTVGLKAGSLDHTWPGCCILRALNLDHCELMVSIISEVRLHLLDLMEDCRIEAVQVCLLLSSIYGYHKSSTLAWNTIGMAIRAAIYLQLYNISQEGQDPIIHQLRRRCWNTVLVMDTYTSMVFGRPVSIDTRFSSLHQIQDLDDMEINPLLLDTPVFQELGTTTSRAPFHNAQFKLYDLIRQTISHIMHLRSSDSKDDFEAIKRATYESETMLTEWRGKIPPLFDFSKWTENNRQERLDQGLQNATPEAKQEANIIILQAATMQLSYDAALILFHQPLLEYKMRSSMPQSTSMINTVHQSLGVAVEAAHRLSQIPVHLFHTHYAISFLFMHLFTAGVTLCLVPPSQPFTQPAQQAKAAVVRIIKSSRAMRNKHRIAKQAEELLTELLTVTTRREMDNALSASGAPQETRPISSQVREPARSSHTDTQDQINTRPSNVLGCPSLYPPNMQNTHALENYAMSFESTGTGADPGLQLPTAQPQAINHFDDIYDTSGQSMFSLLSDSRYSAWDLGCTFPESGEHPLLL